MKIALTGVVLMLGVFGTLAVFGQDPEEPTPTASEIREGLTEIRTLVELLDDDQLYERSLAKVDAFYEFVKAMPEGPKKQAAQDIIALFELRLVPALEYLFEGMEPGPETGFTSDQAAKNASDWLSVFEDVMILIASE